MSKPFGMPGIDGSLGQCALCGNPFLAEIVLGKKIKSFTVDGSDNTFYGHDKCLEQFGNKLFDWKDLPERSPLRQAVERAQSK
jgi:hypothetical protein